MQSRTEQRSDPSAGIRECHVLVVEEDSDCLEEYSEVVDWLGYTCHTAEDARSAFRLIAENPQIGIVVSDIQVPGWDGISFLDVLANRYSALRPLVPLVVTGFGSMERAVEAMRLNAADFLVKPVQKQNFSDALMRAARRWAQLFGEIRMADIAGPDFQLEASASSGFAGSLPLPSERTAEETLGLIRAIVRSRQKRGDFLDTQLFADPAWDILLDLTAAKLQGEVVPVSSACAASNVPMTTALRYIRHLVDAGLVRRWKDQTDARRFLLELEDETMDAMLRYIADFGQSLTQKKG